MGASGLRNLSPHGCTTAREIHGGALFDEALDDPAANAAGAASHHCNLSF